MRKILINYQEIKTNYNQHLQYNFLEKNYQKRNLNELIFPDLDELRPDKYVQKFINVLFDE